MTDIPPKKLYKYLSCNNYTFENLRNGCLWFAKPKNFNDPFDCDINLKIVDATEDNLKKCFDLMRLQVPDKMKFDRIFLQNGRVNKEFESFIIKAAQAGIDEHLKEWNQIGVACFSEKHDDILMWSHYTNSHQGICLEFDTKSSPFFIENKEAVIKVSYSETYPILELSEVVASGGKLRLLRRLLGTKSSHWSYEAEWRLIAKIGDFAHQYDKGSLTGIYLGCKITEENKEIIKSIVGASTPIYEKQRSPIEFKVIVKET